MTSETKELIRKIKERCDCFSSNGCVKCAGEVCQYDIETLESTIESQEKEIERLKVIAIGYGAMNRAPCCICGYNGPGYYQSSTHPCAIHYEREI